MTGRRRFGYARGALITLLVALAFFGTATHWQGTRIQAISLDASSSDSNTSTSDESHEYLEGQASSLAVRLRRDMTPGPGQLSAALLLTALLGATLLAYLVARGPVLSQAPDNLARHRLIGICVDRR